VALVHEGPPAQILAAMIEANPDPDALAHRFRWPDGPELAYDVHAPRHRWVMISVDGAGLNRAFDRWPLLAGTMG
jgi:hypothetical protein